MERRRRSKLPLIFCVVTFVVLGTLSFVLLRRCGMPGDVVDAPQPNTYVDMGVAEGRNVPEASEFEWAEAEWIKFGEIPETAVRLTDWDIVRGAWKGYVRHAQAIVGLDPVDDFLNVSMDGSAMSVTAGLDWHYQLVGEARERHDSDVPDTVLQGHWDGDRGTLHVDSRTESLIMLNFWYEGGRQYAYGLMTFADGATGEIYLTRP